MKKLFKIISFVIIFFILSYGASFVASVSSQSFFEDFTEENLSQEWNFVHVAAGGDISSSEGILNIKASPLFQDSPNSAMVMRHWLSQNDNFLNISVRLKINSFDRFAIQVDHKKPLSYSDLSPMFGLVFRAAGTPTSNYILAVGNQNGEWKGGSGIEGSLISNLKVNEWYQSEIFIQESPYTVVFTLMDNQRNVLIQKTIDANSLTNYNFEEIGSVGFSAWTSLKDGPYGNTDIDWLEVTTESSVEPENDVTFFDDFDGTQLSSDWQVEDRGHNFALNNGSLTLYSDVSSGTTSVAIYREYIPKTDEFTVRARVSSDKLAGFALRLHSGNLPIFGSTQGAELEFDNGVENKNFMAVWKPSGGTWTWTNVYSPVEKGVWFILEMQVQKTPFTITFNVYSDSGTLLGTYTANNIGFNYENIRYICLETWTGPTAYNIDWLEVTTESNPPHTATPTPTPSPVEPGKNPTFISITASSPYSSLGSTIIINGVLFDSNGVTLKDEVVVLSYTFIGSDSWLPISSSSTNNVGEYNVQWINTASGTFTIKAQWAGNTTHSSVSNITSLSILPVEDKTTFLVESNSTISALEFNSTTSELNFIATGQSGTGGYTKVTIAKSLISNSENIKVYLDGNQLEYSLSSNSDFWILNFAYSHSSHNISIKMQSSSTINLLGIDYWYLILAVVIVTIVAIICVLIWQLKTRKKRWANSKKKLLEIVKTNGHIEFNETSKEMGLKITQIKKLLSEVGLENAEAEGFLIKQGTEFISKISIAQKINEMGKFSFVDFASKFGISEDNSKKILAKLLTENMIKGAFSSDGRGFVTEHNLMNEIVKD